MENGEKIESSLCIFILPGENGGAETVILKAGYMEGGRAYVTSQVAKGDLSGIVGRQLTFQLKKGESLKSEKNREK